MLPFRRKTHNSGLCEKKVKHRHNHFQCTWKPDLHQYQGNSELRQLQKIASTSAPCPFPGTMTTETTVSKGQEFFSPGQTEGDTGGTLIGSAAVSLLLLTQLRWTMCTIRTRNFYSQLIATLVGYERKWHEKQGVQQTKLLSGLIIRRISSPAIRQHPLFAEMKKDRHRESATANISDWRRFFSHLWQIFHLKD